ncbi:tetratricopeptide repeat protein [Candidatus Parcubacteria bacterium]|nr:tetratricopeptide repeat protein [Patescibacteria group bacterium]MCG2689305.1 tetratricopeptide repeat protein [Candidatus Parcubacteria bacterium]
MDRLVEVHLKTMQKAETLPPLQQKLSRVSETVNNFSFFGLMAMLPLFFLPTTVEFFSFNKTYLFYALTLIGLVSWGIKMVAHKSFFIKRSILDLPFAVLLLSGICATIFAQNRFYALTGIQGGLDSSLVTLIALILFYYTTTSTVSQKDLVLGLKLLVFGSSLATIIFLLGLVGVNVFGVAWSSYLFNTVGSLSGVVALSTLSAILALFFLIESKSQSNKGLFSLVLSLLLIPVIAYPTVAGIAGIIVGASIVLLFSKGKLLSESFPYLASAVVSCIIFASVINVPQIRSSLNIATPLPREINAPIRESWSVASMIIAENPFFGAGLGNFYSAYSRFKPLSINYTNLWNTRFNKAGSEYINILATSGVVGLLAWILLLTFVIKGFILDKTKVSLSNLGEDSKEASLTLGVKAATVALLVMLLARPSNISLAIVLFGLLAVLASFSNATKEIIKSSSEAAITTLFVFILIAGVSAYFLGRGYVADMLFRQSINDLALGGRNTYNLQRQAVILNPYNDSYRRSYAQASLALANAVAQKENLTDADKSDVQTLISQAIREARVVTEVVAPLNPDNWEVRGAIYRSLDQVAQDALSWAANAYNSAITLDPNSPRLRVDLGGIYFASKDYANAASLFASATNLKNDYANAHYNLAQAYKELKYFADAKTELEIVLRLIPEGSEDAKVVTEDLAQVTAIVVEAQKNAQAQAEAENNKPSVGQIEAKGAVPTPNQEPLTNPAEQNPDTLPAVENPTQ